MEKEEKQRCNYLTVQQFYNLNHACRILTEIFGYSTFHVGSSITSKNWRDVDLRCILKDSRYMKYFGKNVQLVMFLNHCISEWLSTRTGLPIDFQFQNMTSASVEKDKPRNFIGMPFDCVHEKESK